jgi:hypothetical protein
MEFRNIVISNPAKRKCQIKTIEILVGTESVYDKPQEEQLMTF